MDRGPVTAGGAKKRTPNCGETAALTKMIAAPAKIGDLAEHISQG
jgi:hypothetical protein